MRYPPVTYSSICYRRLSDVQSRRTSWLWDSWLPLGKVAILEGDPGLGKSLMTLDLCARLSAGRAFPGSATEGPPCNVVVLNAEDNVHDTIKPRLQTLGANLERVFFMDGVVDKKGEEPIRFPAHAQALRDLLRQTQARLMVLDPFVAFLDTSVASHNDQSVRAALALLTALADEQQCAVLLVRHLNKNEEQRGLYRGGGSIGFLAAVRCAWLIAADPEHPRRRVLAQVKNNLRALPASLALEINRADDDGSTLTWLGVSAHSSDRLLGRKQGRGRPRTQRERAGENLKLFLEEAPRRVDDVREFAREQKISERTLMRIKQDLAVRSMRAPDGDGRSTFWLLPGQLPQGVSEEMLSPVETREQEIQAAQEESDQLMRELIRKYGGEKRGGEGRAE